MLAALTVIGSAALAVVPAATATTPSHKHHRRHRHAGVDRGCAGADARVGHASPKLLRSAVVCLINQARSQHHLPPLSASPQLHHSAQAWTDAMVSSDQFTHGTNFAGRISAAGYVWRSAGENIATGFSTPRSVVHAWMGSTGHCENILNPTFRNVGTGVSTRPVKGYATGTGTWTQDFALGMHSSPPSGNTRPMYGCPY
ncbi:MAG TPA: CAP domain-containing protein [Solirubrobacteraceae bacterium]|nr:CAP domain-containing protein [Solirubrobacteraceae bacterium]